jgi:PTH2 family peptidyl-tRNA hydrolase
MSEPKQIIILRKDLNMRKGKMVAQGAHASMAVFFNDSEYREREYGSPRPDVLLMNVRSSAMKEWVQGRFTKICVSVNSEQELRDIFNQAANAGLPCSLIQDAGLTEFDGVPTYTAVAIGPAYPEEIDPITKHLPLL